MTVRQVLPPGLAQMAPGPQLGVALAGLDNHALTGGDLVEVMRARARQLAHEQAQLLATMVEVGLCDPGAGAEEVGRLAQAPEWAADEIRAALAWTRNAAYREYHFAQTLLGRLPAEAWFNVVHLCGSNLNFGLAKDFPAQAVSWSIHNQGNPSLVEGRKSSGRAVMGGLGQRASLLYGPPTEVEAEARQAVEETGGRGLLLAPGCSVPSRAKDANLAAMVSAIAA